MSLVLAHQPFHGAPLENKHCCSSEHEEADVAQQLRHGTARPASMPPRYALFLPRHAGKLHYSISQAHDPAVRSPEPTRLA